MMIMMMMKVMRSGVQTALVQVVMVGERVIAIIATVRVIWNVVVVLVMVFLAMG